MPLWKFQTSEFYLLIYMYCVLGRYRKDSYGGNSNPIHFEREGFASMSANFAVTKKFLITKFDYNRTFSRPLEN